MFSKSPESFWHSTELKLTLWYALLFLVSWLVLFVVGFTILNTSFRTKDRQIVTQMLERFRVIADTQGVGPLITTLKGGQLSHISGGYFVMVRAKDRSLLYLSLPYEWRSLDSNSLWSDLPFSDSRWVVQETDHALHVEDDTRDDELEILGRRLAGGALLQVGYSAQGREDLLESLRDLFLWVMGPIALFSLAFGALLARRALKPVRDLTTAVMQVQSGQIDTRVPLDGTENELKALAGQFNTMLDRIEVLIAGMREALDNVAHDLRTPLMRMRAAIENSVVSDEPEKHREALLDCAEESQRISEMLTVLMDISEAETGVMKLNYSEFPLAELVQEVKDLYLYSAEEKHLALDFQTPDDLRVNADYVRLRQVLCNLMDNAIKFTPDPGQISLRAEQSETQLTLTVQDSGIGIPADDQGRIFDRLYRSDKSRSQKGLGLGLSLVKAVVVAHEGTIRVSSTLNEGTTFHLTLPNTSRL